ncbi:MAG: hypothetical protein A2W23_00235 [Planctomycetes bacterium RBG_16_43_13]|nr:MAG: hypothetical protein A2W23_00235 [Planctomycetes bacterium RBG_16_43_13]
MAIFLILFFLSFFLLVIGLIKPIMVILWGEKRTRGRVLIYYGISAIVFFVLFGISSDYKERALKNMTPAQHLSEAQSILYSGKTIEERIKTIGSLKIAEARKHLDAIKPEDPEYADAQNMKEWASNLENIQMKRKKQEVAQPVMTEQEQADLKTKQDKRVKVIQGFINAGIFQKVEVADRWSEVWVMPAFYNMDYDSKATYTNIVWAYYIAGDPKREIVMLYDSKTGKHVGTYSKHGLDMK